MVVILQSKFLKRGNIEVTVIGRSMDMMFGDIIIGIVSYHSYYGGL